MLGGILKVCGMIDPENLREVMKLRPDWVGLIFYPPSPRFVKDSNLFSHLKERQDAAKIMGVFVNPTRDEIYSRNEIVGFDGVQLHGQESPEFCFDMKQQGFKVFKAFGIHPDFNFDITDAYEGSIDFFLFDTKSANFGGTGEQFDWDILSDYKGRTPFLLSGGISSETNIFPDHPHFAGVDLNSRFEISPGIKDISLLEAYIKRFRNV
jgi:phosphoribosylanthranilate isomerase